MLFRTELNLNKSVIDINYTNNILLIGSCFSNNIGNKLVERKFKTKINPFGTVYNSASIKNLIEYASNKKQFKSEELDLNQNIYSHRDFHSHFNSQHPYLVLNKLNNHLIDFSDQLHSFDITFITLGTSWVYRSNNDNSIVSNCHKHPQNLFTKCLLSLDENVIELKKIIQLLHAKNSNNKIIFTISPVRHIKDGIVENQISKSILIHAVYEVCKNQNCYYFPSYEIMMDDLRDYRYYKEDMIHPTDQAVDYIWEKFIGHYFNEKIQSTIQKIEKINTFLLHRPQRENEIFNIQRQKIDEMILELKVEQNIDFL